MADTKTNTKRQRIEKRINNINKREKKRGTPQAKIDRQTKLYRDQLAKLPTRVSPAPGKPKPVVKPKPIVNKGSKPIAKSRNQTVIEKELARQREIKADPKGYAAKRKAEEDKEYYKKIASWVGQILIVFGAIGGLIWFLVWAANRGVAS